MALGQACPLEKPEGAMCVQKLDGSLRSAIHTTCRISLRSSSMPEPRDPLLRVFFWFSFRCLDGNVASGFVLSSGGVPRWSGGTGRRGNRGFWARVVRSGLRFRGHPRRSLMIPPQVHLRRPCYDFYFL